MALSGEETETGRWANSAVAEPAIRNKGRNDLIGNMLADRIKTHDGANKVVCSQQCVNKTEIILTVFCTFLTYYRQGIYFSAFLLTQSNRQLADTLARSGKQGVGYGRGNRRNARLTRSAHFLGAGY